MSRSSVPSSASSEGFPALGSPFSLCCSIYRVVVCHSSKIPLRFGSVLFLLRKFSLCQESLVTAADTQDTQESSKGRAASGRKEQRFGCSLSWGTLGVPSASSARLAVYRLLTQHLGAWYMRKEMPRVKITFEPAGTCSEGRIFTEAEPWAQIKARELGAFSKLLSALKKETLSLP